MRYWDASALLPLIAVEAATPHCNRLLESDQVIVTWWGTEIECVSALARLEREGQLAAEPMTAALARLDALVGVWFEVEPRDAVRETARRLLRVHPLRAADSLQLAAAVVAAENRPSSLEFVCSDRRLADAARRENFPVVFPGEAEQRCLPPGKP